MISEKKRCFGNGMGKEFYADYHDYEWGIPMHDDRQLFELLILEGAQAGLSWETILKRRAAYRRAFHHFDPALVAQMTDDELRALQHDPSIIRNRLKILSARTNAAVFLAIQKEFGSFDRYIWTFVANTSLVNHWTRAEEVPVSTPISDRLAHDLKKRGMSFVGSTIIYAYMQAIGMVNDHLMNCWTRRAQSR